MRTKAKMTYTHPKEKTSDGSSRGVFLPFIISGDAYFRVLLLVKEEPNKFVAKPTIPIYHSLHGVPV